MGLVTVRDVHKVYRRDTQAVPVRIYRLNKVIDAGTDPATAVKDACKLMNDASGL